MVCMLSYITCIPGPYATGNMPDPPTPGGTCCIMGFDEACSEVVVVSETSPSTSLISGREPPLRLRAAPRNGSVCTEDDVTGVVGAELGLETSGVCRCLRELEERSPPTSSSRRRTVSSSFRRRPTSSLSFFCSVSICASKCAITSGKEGILSDTEARGISRGTKGSGVSCGRRLSMAVQSFLRLPHALMPSVLNISSFVS
mmetsp:Transcript_21277/g.46308  ORF Transcript_21277/g.46308 Transcript_21277/m.46308 type:complete len:201 (+) Transcript_21277:473-1075(+)